MDAIHFRKAEVMLELHRVFAQALFCCAPAHRDGAHADQVVHIVTWHPPGLMTDRQVVQLMKASDVGIDFVEF